MHALKLRFFLCLLSTCLAAGPGQSKVKKTIKYPPILQTLPPKCLNIIIDYDAHPDIIPLFYRHKAKKIIIERNHPLLPDTIRHDPACDTDLGKPLQSITILPDGTLIAFVKFITSWGNVMDSGEVLENYKVVTHSLNAGEPLRVLLNNDHVGWAPETSFQALTKDADSVFVMTSAGTIYKHEQVDEEEDNSIVYVGFFHMPKKYRKYKRQLVGQHPGFSRGSAYSLAVQNNQLISCAHGTVARWDKTALNQPKPLSMELPDGHEMKEPGIPKNETLDQMFERHCKSEPDPEIVISPSRTLTQKLNRETEGYELHFSQDCTKLYAALSQALNPHPEKARN